MANSGVVIKITGDASDFEKELQSTQRSAKSAAASLASEYKKIGMDAPAALKRAWAEVRKAQETGSTIKIKGVETAIAQSDKLKSSLGSVNQAANNAANGVSKSAGNAGKSIEKIGDSAKDAADDVEKSSGRMARGLKTVTSTASKIASGVGSVIGTMVKWGSLLWSGAGVATVMYTANIEQLQTSFEVMTGSAEKAAEVIDRIRTMGAETPFEMGDLASTVQLLMNYGLTADDAMSKMSMLGDIAQGNAEKMTSIATAYGQMRSAGKVQLEDVKQMIEAGFNPLQIISEKTGESMASLYDRISKGTLAVSEITAAMEAATSAGGKYFQSMQKQSQTLSGMFSTLKDNLQQLGGDIFKPVTDNLKSTILPGAISMIDQISRAFKARGIDGIISTLSRQTPKLLNATAKMLRTALDGAASKLPLIADGLLKSLPDLLGNAVEIAPQIGDMLFDLFAQGIEYLVGNLPTLAPMLLRGVGNMIKSVVLGLGHAAEGLVRGIGDALKNAGVIEWSPEEQIEQSFDSLNPDEVEEYTKYFTITPEVTIEEPEVELTSIYEEIEKTLTDGEADTEEIVAALKEKVEAYYQAQIDKVNEWRQSALDGLDSTLPTSEYSQAAAEINAQADAMVAGFENASNQTITFIENNAGKATAAVKANASELETIYQNALGYANQIAALTGESRTAVQKQQTLVAGGASSDPEVIGSALSNTAAQFQSSMDTLNQERADALVKAQSQYANDLNGYKNAEAQINAQFAAQQQTLVNQFKADMAMLWTGISSALSPEASEAFQQVQTAQQLQQKINGFTDALVSAFSNPQIQSGEISMAEYISQIFEGAGFTDADYAVLAQAMGLDEIDPAIIQQELMTKLLQGMQGGATATDKNAFVQQMLSNMGLDGAVMQILNEIAGMEGFDEVQKLFETGMSEGTFNGLQEGMYEGIEGINFDDPITRMLFLLGGLGDKTQTTIGKELTEGIDGAEANGTPTVTVNDPEVDTSGVPEEVATATQEAVDSAPPAETTQQVDATVETTVTSTDDSGIEEAVNTELAAQTMTVDVNAAVSLNVTVSDSNASTVGTAAGNQLGSGLVSGIASKADSASNAGSIVALSAASGARGAYGQMQAAGAYAGQGFQAGLASKRTAILATARGIANSVAATIRMALDINSPSRVMMQLGQYTGEGFEIGAVKSFQHAMKTINRSVGELNLAPRTAAPDFAGALSAAASGAYSAEASRPIYLMVNGKVLGQAVSRDIRTANNSYNRSIALGVGKK